MGLSMFAEDDHNDDNNKSNSVEPSQMT
ncbi:hypothetical protein Goshw_010595, partial [Gossypium schwendimanii]|nr:hypothetical protein [Gossypium schwendimanii]